MRTTLTIDDDVLRAARSIAAEEGRSMGQVISELARKGLRPDPVSSTEEGFPVFQVSDDAPPLTPEMVERANQD